MKLLSWPFNSSTKTKIPAGKVCITLSAYNCANWIEETIDSIIRQTHQDWVLYVTDDNSTDGTDAILRQICQNEPRIKLTLNPKNMGPYYNHNNARSWALRQEDITHFTLIDGDDIADPRWLEHNLCLCASSNALGIRPINVRVSSDNTREIFKYPAVNQTFWPIETIRILGAYNLEVKIGDSEFMKRAEQLATLTNSWICLSLSNNHRMRVHNSNLSATRNKQERNTVSRIDCSTLGIKDLFLPLDK